MGCMAVVSSAASEISSSSSSSSSSAMGPKKLLVGSVAAVLADGVTPVLPAGALLSELTLAASSVKSIEASSSGSEAFGSVPA